MRLRLFAFMAAFTVAGGSMFAAGDALCKSNCLSQRSLEIAKHRCCPEAALKLSGPVKLTQHCGNCFERTNTPAERGQFTPNPVEPVSISETEIISPERKPVGSLSARPSHESRPHFSTSIPIQLHRILV